VVSWLRLSPLILLGGCGGRSVPKMPGIKNPFSVEIKDVYMQWPLYMTYMSGLLVFVGVIWLLWGRRKDSAIRLIATGMVLAMVAKLLIFFGIYMWWFMGAIAIVYAVCNPMIIENVFLKFNLRFDFNRDGHHGTPSKWFNKKDVKNKEALENPEV